LVVSILVAGLSDGQGCRRDVIEMYAETRWPSSQGKATYSEIECDLDILSLDIGEKACLLVRDQFVGKGGCRDLTDECDQEAEQQRRKPHAGGFVEDV
jgi:hypothetical protein